MNTKYIAVDINDIQLSDMEEAGNIIKSGGLVAFPTETVYGLGGDGLNANSSKKIYEAKGRPSDNPLIIHIADMNDLYTIAKDVPEEAIVLADKYWPGPLTMIFPKKDVVPYETTGGLDTVAVRFPSHPVAQAFIKAAGGFVAAPSANISGRPSPTLASHVYEDLNGRIDMIIDSGSCDIGLESTIIDFSEGIPMMLRPGYVSHQMLAECIGEVRKDPAVFGDNTEGVAPKAPGMKYRHYAPAGMLAIVSGEAEAVKDYILEKISERKDGTRIGVLTCEDSVSVYAGADFVGNIGNRGDEQVYASRLYNLLRECDSKKIDIIYSEEFDTPQLGMAIMNRLIKAAGHTIIKV